MEDYKAGQGSLTRLVTWMIVIAAAFLGCVELYSWLPRMHEASLVPLEWFRNLPVFGVPFSLQFVATVLVFVGLMWFVRWLMHRPQTVDTLIETELEMKKVSWPTRAESMNATWVVILVTLALTLSLWAFDAGLRLVFGLVF